MSKDQWQKVSESSLTDGFTDVYDKYVEKIYKFIYYKTYHRETAEDLTSTTFLKALAKWESFDPRKGEVSTWLYRIARNLVIDYYRSKKHTLAIQDVWDLAGDVDPVLDLQNRSQLEEVQQVLSALPLEQRDILIMRIWQNLSYREIAGILGRTEGACKMTFSRTMTRLKQQFSAMTLVLLLLFHWLT